MSFAELLNKVAKLPPPNPSQPEVLPLELAGFFVRWVRHLRQLKRETLANLAGISISTIERVERGQRVSSESLEHIEIALGYGKGYLTAPRFPRSEQETVQALAEQFGDMEVVAVRPLRTQPHVRELAQCHAFLPYCFDHGEDLKMTS